MLCTSSEDNIEEFYRHALSEGISKEQLFSSDNLKEYIDTSVDGYRKYPLFVDMFKGNYNEAVLSRMMNIDYKSRIGRIAGIASSENYESVMLLEPPCSEKVSMLQYFKIAKISDYMLYFRPSLHRQQNYEDYALSKRKPYLDEKTWYVYVFVTKGEFQRHGYGKKLMHVACSFADKTGTRICLETNQDANVAMYEQFGFKLKDTSVYKNRMDHFVMVYGE